MRRSLEEKILEDIDQLLIKLNEKMDKLAMLELWLLNLREETSGKKNILVI